MTRDEIMALDAGPELDALVARRVLGFVRMDRCLTPPEGSVTWRPDNEERFVPAYSTDIVAAWEIIDESWRLRRWLFDLDAFAVFGEMAWSVDVCKREHGGLIAYTGHDPNANVELQICRAALLAIEAETQS